MECVVFQQSGITLSHPNPCLGTDSFNVTHDYHLSLISKWFQKSQSLFLLGGGAVLAFVGLWNFYLHSKRIKHANLRDLYNDSHDDILYPNNSFVTSGDQIIKTCNWPITWRLWGLILSLGFINAALGRYDPLFCISFRINNLLTWNGFIFQTGLKLHFEIKTLSHFRINL